MKCYLLHAGFELMTPCSFPATITITQRVIYWYIHVYVFPIPSVSTQTILSRNSKNKKEHASCLLHWSRNLLCLKGCYSYNVWGRNSLSWSTNEEFSFSKIGCHNKVKYLSLSNYLLVLEVRIVEFIPFARLLPLCEIQKDMSRIWTRVAVSIFDNHGVMVIHIGNEHGDTSSNPGRDWLHFT